MYNCQNWNFLLMFSVRILGHWLVWMKFKKNTFCNNLDKCTKFCLKDYFKLDFLENSTAYTSHSASLLP